MMTRRAFFFRTVATMIALRVPWATAKADVTARVMPGIRLGVPVFPPGEIFLLQIAGPDWKLIKKWKVKNLAAIEPLQKRLQVLSSILDADLPVDLPSRARLSKLVAIHSGGFILRNQFPAPAAQAPWHPIDIGINTCLPMNSDTLPAENEFEMLTKENATTKPCA